MFDRENVDATVASLLDSQTEQQNGSGHEAAKRRLSDAEARIRRFQDAIAAGVDPVAVVDPLNRAQAEHSAARTEIANAPASEALTDAEVYAMIDSLGNVGVRASRRRPCRAESALSAAQLSDPLRAN